jgi:hypothetical protein
MFDDDEKVWYEDCPDVPATILRCVVEAFDYGCDCCGRMPGQYDIRLEDGTVEENVYDWNLRSRDA